MDYIDSRPLQKEGRIQKDLAESPGHASSVCRRQFIPEPIQVVMANPSLKLLGLGRPFGIPNRSLKVCHH